MNYIIGCGGVGSWLAHKLARYLGPDGQLTLIDGDHLEEKNLDRQFFDEGDVGQNKALALARKFMIGDNPQIGEVNSKDQFYQAGLFRARRSDWLFCCADNHACRKEVLKACDLYGCRAIIGANEYTDSEAYIYLPEFKDTPNDPRVFYPNILTDRSGDPLNPEGCVELSQESPQLILANDWASSQMLHLYYFWTKVQPNLEPATEPHWPTRHRVSQWKFWTEKKGGNV